MSAENGHGPVLTSALVRSVVGEVAERLAAFANSGETAAIDLRSLPMSDTDRAELLAWLGEGEIAIALEVAGPSRIHETRFTGVWWVRHFGSDDRIAAERIEIAPVPEILIADRADIAAASVRLAAEIAADSVQPPREVAEHV